MVSPPPHTHTILLFSPNPPSFFVSPLKTKNRAPIRVPTQHHEGQKETHRKTLTIRSRGGLYTSARNAQSFRATETRGRRQSHLGRWATGEAQGGRHRGCLKNYAVKHLEKLSGLRYLLSGSRKDGRCKGSRVKGNCDVMVPRAASGVE